MPPRSHRVDTWKGHFGLRHPETHQRDSFQLPFSFSHLYIPSCLQKYSLFIYACIKDRVFFGRESCCPQKEVRCSYEMRSLLLCKLDGSNEVLGFVKPLLRIGRGEDNEGRSSGSVAQSLRFPRKTCAQRLEIRQWHVRPSEPPAARAEPRSAIGSGNHTGPAVAGKIGSEQRMQCAAIGDTVNVSSRLVNQAAYIYSVPWETL